MIDYIKHLIFPTRCPFCNKVIGKPDCACEACKKKFPKMPIITYAFGGVRCCSPFFYTEIFSDAIKRLKFRNMPRLAVQLADPLTACIEEVYGKQSFDVIVCVPMHKSMQRQRRYNQSEWLARECAKIMDIPYVSALEKHKQNKAQHTVSGKERASNVKGVFRVIDPTLVEGKNVLIIDDVITSGHTMGECAAVLKKAGCKSVCGATVCAAMSAGFA